MTGLTIQWNSSAVNINFTAIPMETTLPLASTNEVQNNVTELAEGILAQNVYSLNGGRQTGIQVLTQHSISPVPGFTELERLGSDIEAFDRSFNGFFSLETQERIDSLLDRFQMLMEALPAFRGTTSRHNLLRRFSSIMAHLIAHGEVSSFEHAVRNYPFLRESEFCTRTIVQELIKTAMQRGDNDMLSAVLNNYLLSIVDLPALIGFACQRRDLGLLTLFLSTALYKGLPLEQSIVTALLMHLSMPREIVPFLLDQLSSLSLFNLAKQWIESWGRMYENFPDDYEHFLRMLFTKAGTSMGSQALDELFKILLWNSGENFQGLALFIETNSSQYHLTRLICITTNVAEHGQIHPLKRLLFVLKHLNINQEVLHCLVEFFQKIGDKRTHDTVLGLLARVFGSTVVDIVLSQCDLDLWLLGNLMEGILGEGWGDNSERTLKKIFQKIKEDHFAKDELITFLKYLSSFCTTKRPELLSLFRQEFSVSLDFAIARLLNAIARLLNMVPTDRAASSEVVVTGFASSNFRRLDDDLLLLRNLGITPSQLAIVYQTLYEGAPDGRTIVPYRMANFLRSLFPPTEFPAAEIQLAALERKNEARILSKLSDSMQQLLWQARHFLVDENLEEFQKILDLLNKNQIPDRELDSVFFCLEKIAFEAKETVGVDFIWLVTDWMENYGSGEALCSWIGEVVFNGSVQELKELLRQFQLRRPSQAEIDNLRSVLEENVDERRLSAVLAVWREVFPETAALESGLASIALSE